MWFRAIRIKRLHGPNWLVNRHSALAMALVRFLNRIPSLKSLMSTPRMEAEKQALELMKQVSMCRFGLVPPETPAADALQASGAGMEVIGSRTRTAKRSQTAGLL